MPKLSHVLLAIAICWIVYRAFRGRVDYRELERSISVGDKRALDKYLGRAIVRKAIVGISCASLLVIYGGGIPFQMEHATIATTAVTCLGVVLAMFGSVALFRSLGNWPLRLLMRTAGALIPTTPKQRRLFLGLSLCAGFEEELLFRWFLTSQLLGVPGVGVWSAFALSSVIFGFAHLYQGWRGTIVTGMLGVCLSGLWIASGSLLVSMVSHMLLDARIPFILTERRRKSLLGNP